MPEAKRLRRDEPAHYQICVWGALDASWTDMFGGLRLACECCGGGSHFITLSGIVTDQAALMGMLSFAYELGCVLLRVEFKGAADR